MLNGIKTNIGFYTQPSDDGKYAPINSPVFTGTPKAPTQEISSDSNNIATIGNLQDLNSNSTYFSVTARTYNDMTSGDVESVIKLDNIISQNSNDFDISQYFYVVPETGIYNICFSISPQFQQNPSVTSSFPDIDIRDFETKNVKLSYPVNLMDGEKNYFLSISVYLSLTKNEKIYLTWIPNGSNFNGIILSPFFSGQLVKKL